MKKNHYTILALLGLLGCASGQTIDINNFSIPNAQNDLYRIGAPGTYGPATTGANQTWDYSNVVPASMGSVIYYSAADSVTGYPDVHTYVYRNLVSPTGATIDAYLYYNYNAAGFYIAAHYTAPFSESLTSFTGTPGDELVIPGQRLTYTDSLFALKFPVNYQDAWSGSINRIVNFNLTIGAFGLANTPGYFKATENETRTVVGQGNIIIPDENGNPLPAVPAFMIRVNRTITDSIYLAGSPAPPALLNAFGLTQGTVITQSFVLFYTNNVTSMPVASYNLDAANNLVFFGFRPEVARMASSFNVNENFVADLNVYPNPVSAGSSLQLDYNNAAQAEQFALYNLNGQLVQRGALTFNDRLAIDADIPSGLYFLHLENAQGLPIARTKLQIQ